MKNLTTVSLILLIMVLFMYCTKDSNNGPDLSPVIVTEIEPDDDIVLIEGSNIIDSDYYSNTSNDYIPDTILAIDEYSLIQSNISFPLVTMGIFLKETSFCRCNYRSNDRASPCCYEKWQAFVSFCPNNLFGMKHPSNRITTSKGPIKDFLKGFDRDELPWWIAKYKDSDMAVYTSVEDAMTDMRLWQQSTFRRYGTPDDDQGYRKLLKDAVYNPYDSYHIELKDITSDYNEFYSKYGRRLKSYHKDVYEQNIAYIEEWNNSL